MKSAFLAALKKKCLIENFDQYDIGIMINMKANELEGDRLDRQKTSLSPKRLFS